MTTQKILVTLIVIVLCTGVDCKKDIVNPPTDDIKPGRRDYVWTIDTLKPRKGDSFIPTQIWGITPNDIWVSGFGSSSVSLLYHYDGVKWTRDSLQRRISPSSLWGTASNNIWFGNDNSSMWRYNGQQWYEFGTYTPQGFSSNSVLDIHGVSENEIYGVGGARNNTDTGHTGTLMRYKDGMWQFIQLPVTHCLFTEVYQEARTGLLFIGGTDDSTYKIYKYDGSDLSLIYSNREEGAHVYAVKGEIYLAIGKKIFKYSTNQLQLWKDFSNTDFVGVIYGRTEKDFFTYTTNDFITWGIGHYNGSDLQTIYNFPEGFRMSGLLMFEQDVFVQGFSDLNTSVVVHGALQDH